MGFKQAYVVVFVVVVLFLLLLFFLVFLGLHQRHMEVPRLGVKSDL